jgi:hypothetical protein
MAATKKAVASKAALPHFEEKDLPYWDDSDFKGGLDELDEVAGEMIALQQERTVLEDRIKEKAVVVRALMESVNDRESWSVRGGGWTSSYVRPKPRETLVKERLVELGVSWKTIEKATKRTPATPYVSVRAKKEEGE